MQYNPQLCAKAIREKTSIQPTIGIILGSGLSELGASLQDCVEIDYEDIPGFPSASVSGHSGKVSIGYLQGKAVICLQGRVHRYEGTHAHIAVKNMIRALKCLGVKDLIITNASGSLNAEMPPGSIMMITDHINFQLDNPLLGDNDEEFGPRFPPVDQAYHPAACEIMRACAKQCEVKLYEGVYISVMGPSYETKAEIRTFKHWGADAVGMSTVPDVLVANHCGLRITALAVITNYATGLATQSHDHKNVVDTAQKAASSLQNLINEYIARIDHDI